VLGREAYRVRADAELDPIAATVVRVGFSAMLLWVIAMFRGRAMKTLTHLGNPAIRGRIIVGTFLGPLLGMIGFVSALKFAPAGLVSTIISASPLVILPVIAVRIG